MSLCKHRRLAVAIVLLLPLAAACSGPEPGAGIPKQLAEAEDQDGAAEHGNHEERDEGVVVLTPEAASRVRIRTAPAAKRVLAAELTTTGQVDFDQTRLAHVSPRISGRVQRVDAVLGQEVRAGQKLAEIDSIELGQAKAAYLQAKAKEELARKSFDRAQGLLADRIASEQEMLEAEATFREASAGLHTADEILHLYGLSQAQVEALTYDDRQASIYPLRAPFAGTVIERHATLGELVTPERNLFTLADLSRVWIWIDVYERDLGGVHLKDEARVEVDAYPGMLFRGLVSYLSSQVDTDSRTVRARIDVPNPEAKLRPGMFARVRLFDPHGVQGRRQAAECLVVPEEAVQRDGDGSIVFVPTGPLSGSRATFERRRVRTGRKAGGLVEILDGLEAAELVVVEGAFLLKSEASKEAMGGGHEH